MPWHTPWGQRSPAEEQVWGCEAKWPAGSRLCHWPLQSRSNIWSIYMELALELCYNTVLQRMCFMTDCSEPEKTIRAITNMLLVRRKNQADWKCKKTHTFYRMKTNDAMMKIHLLQVFFLIELKKKKNSGCQGLLTKQQLLHNTTAVCEVNMLLRKF